MASTQWPVAFGVWVGEKTWLEGLRLGTQLRNTLVISVAVDGLDDGQS